MAETATALTEQQFASLKNEKFVMLGTVDAENGSPTLNGISWIYAVDQTKLRFALDQRSRLVANVKANPRVTIAFFGGGTLNTVYGTAEIVTDALEDVPFKLACVDVSIEAVRDGMFYGSRITIEPEYEKTYDKRAADKLDGQVFAAMNKA